MCLPSTGATDAPTPARLATRRNGRTWGRRDRVKEIRFVPGSKAPEDMSAFFEDMFALRRVDFTNLDMSKTVSLAWDVQQFGLRGR